MTEVPSLICSFSKEENTNLDHTPLKGILKKSLLKWDDIWTRIRKENTLPLCKGERIKFKENDAVSKLFSNSTFE